MGSPTDFVVDSRAVAKYGQGVITCTVTNPSGSRTETYITPQSDGTYKISYSPSEEGIGFVLYTFESVRTLSCLDREHGLHVHTLLSPYQSEYFVVYVLLYRRFLSVGTTKRSIVYKWFKSSKAYGFQLKRNVYFSFCFVITVDFNSYTARYYRVKHDNGLITVQLESVFEQEQTKYFFWKINIKYTSCLYVNPLTVFIAIRYRWNILSIFQQRIYYRKTRAHGRSRDCENYVLCKIPPPKRIIK